MRASIKFFDWLLAGALACPIMAMSHDAVLAGCKPDHLKPPFFIKSMGACAFDPETLSYTGTPVQQAMCLMRGMDVSRNLLPQLSSLPAPLASRIGQTTGLPSRATLSNYLAQQDPEGASATIYGCRCRVKALDPNRPIREADSCSAQISRGSPS